MNTCTTIPAARCTRRPTFTPCAGASAPEGIRGNFGYANLIRVRGLVGAHRPFCDAA